MLCLLLAVLVLAQPVVLSRPTLRATLIQVLDDAVSKHAVLSGTQAYLNEPHAAAPKISNDKQKKKYANYSPEARQILAAAPCAPVLHLS